MKRVFNTFVSLFTIVLLGGCIREGIETGAPKVISEFKVSIEAESATKAILDSETGEVTWDQYGDVIGVFSDLHPDIIEYVWDRYERDSEGREIFRGEAIEGNHFYAVYPYSAYADENEEYYDDTYTIKKDPDNPLRIRYYLQPGSLNRGSSTWTGPVTLMIPMVAKSDDAYFKFKQTVSIFHFKIKGEGYLPWVILSGNQHEPVQGDGYIDMSEDSPVYKLDYSKIPPYDRMAVVNNAQPNGNYFANASVDIDHFHLEGDDEIDILFALPPMVFEKGVSLRLQYSRYFNENSEWVGEDENVTKVTAKRITASRGKIKHFTIVDKEIVELENENGSDEEKEALMAIYNKMGGDSWTHSDNWGTDAPLKDWYGVVVDDGVSGVGNGRVMGLQLNNNNLCGIIPEELGDLIFIESIDFSHNSITGSSEYMEPLKNLWSLSLVGNPLDQFPISLFRGGDLLSLGLSLPEGQSIPEELYEYGTKLESLTLECSSISGLDRFKSLWYLSLSGLKGEIPDNLCDLLELKRLTIESGSLSGTIPSGIGKLINLNRLNIVGPISGPIPEELFLLPNIEDITIESNYLTGQIPSTIGNCHELGSLRIVGPISGPLPEDLYDCTTLYSLEIGGADLGQPISPNISKLTNLHFLSLCDCNLRGNIPPELFSIQSLSTVYLTENVLTGNIPVELISSNVSSISLAYNDLSGVVNPAFKDWKYWTQLWAEIVVSNFGLDCSQAMPRFTQDFSATCTDGTNLSYYTTINKPLNIIFQWEAGERQSTKKCRMLKSLYNEYLDKGLLSFYGCAPGAKAYDAMPYIDNQQMPWKNFIPEHSPIIDLAPMVFVYNSSGEMVFTDLMDDLDDLPRFIANYFGLEYTEYASSDYSSDGVVHILHSKTEGKGVSIIFLGDAFSDRLIADGTYDSWMRRAYDALFEEEPYKSCKHLFNVYYIDAVSKNETYKGETALGSSFTKNIADMVDVGANKDKVINYLRLVLSDEEISDAAVLVIPNRDIYGGTAHYYLEGSADCDYGRGVSIACVPAYEEYSGFNRLVLHEYGGHAFAKLADEYIDASAAGRRKGSIDEGEASFLLALQQRGYYKNVDVTNDPNQVLWSRFLSDERYADEGIGIYEGAYTYQKGVYRPTEESIMNHNTGGFNAPSRYAIWYRINKLAYGDEWTGTYEDFVEFDLAHRPATTKASTQSRNFVEQRLPPLHPPVIVDKDWREVVSGR
jgi:hypothetical protein